MKVILEHLFYSSIIAIAILIPVFGIYYTLIQFLFMS